MARSRQSRRDADARGPRKVAPTALRPRTRRTLWLALGAALLLAVAANFAIDQKAHFGIDGSFGFYAWFGFLACVALIVLGKIVGVFVRRDPDYYRAGADAGTAPPGGQVAGTPRPGTEGGKSGP